MTFATSQIQIKSNIIRAMIVKRGQGVLFGMKMPKMKLYLAKPDLVYFEQFNEMMKEWCESGTQIAPWFLDEPFEAMEVK